MDFRYTTEQEMYRQAIREWLVKNLEPRARAVLRRGREPAIRATRLQRNCPHTERISRKNRVF